MNIKKEIELAKKRVYEEGLLRESLVKYLSERRIYHTVAIIIFSKVFNEEINVSKDFIYDNEFYNQFKFESNPFNEDFIRSNKQ